MKFWKLSIILFKVSFRMNLKCNVHNLNSLNKYLLFQFYMHIVIISLYNISLNLIYWWKCIWLLIMQHTWSLIKYFKLVSVLDQLKQNLQQGGIDINCYTDVISHLLRLGWQIMNDILLTLWLQLVLVKYVILIYISVVFIIRNFMYSQ